MKPFTFLWLCLLPFIGYASTIDKLEKRYISQPDNQLLDVAWLTSAYRHCFKPIDLHNIDANMYTENISPDFAVKALNQMIWILGQSDRQFKEIANSMAVSPNNLQLTEKKCQKLALAAQNLLPHFINSLRFNELRMEMTEQAGLAAWLTQCTKESTANNARLKLIKNSYDELPDFRQKFKLELARLKQHPPSKERCYQKLANAN